MRSLSAVGSRIAKLNTTGIEYISFIFLYGWGVICVALNYFLWIFRFAIEKSGLAPASWYNKDQRPPKGA